MLKNLKNRFVASRVSFTTNNRQSIIRKTTKCLDTTPKKTVTVLGNLRNSLPCEET